MISLNSISKSFRLYNSPADRLKEIVFRRSRHAVHKALNSISFSVADGETLGIIGRNGAGKSTLLKILLGVLLPDEGTVQMDGRVTGLLELGTGFNYEMSGYDNIYFNGTLIGMDKEQITAAEKQIIDFAELGDFISKPIKLYSSGMVMRLAFSIAVHSEPKCFVVDEALSVGDAYFQQKCMKKFREFKKNGGSIIFVSHDMGAVKMLCDNVLLLEKGNIVFDGKPEDAVNKYNFLIARAEEKGSGNLLVSDDKSYGNFEIEIKNVEIKGAMSGTSAISSGERAVVSVFLRSNTDHSDISVGIMLRDRFGQDIFGTNTFLNGYDLSVSKGMDTRVDFLFDLNINVGKYTVTAAVHTGNTHVFNCFHWLDSACSFEVAGYRDKEFAGVAGLVCEINTTELTPG